MIKILKFSIFALLILISQDFSAQIKIKELPNYNLESIDSEFLENSSTRDIIPLRSGWQIYTPDSPDEKAKISTPSVFEGTSELIYERGLSFKDDEISNKNIELVFLGLNYSAEILINNKLIYKHPGGELPFTVILPRDLLKYGEINKTYYKTKI